MVNFLSSCCRHYGSGKVSGTLYLVLEDFRRRGFSTCGRSGYHTPRQMSASSVTLALIHSLSYCLQRLGRARLIARVGGRPGASERWIGVKAVLSLDRSGTGTAASRRGLLLIANVPRSDTRLGKIRARRSPC